MAKMTAHLTWYFVSTVWSNHCKQVIYIVNGFQVILPGSLLFRAGDQPTIEVAARKGALSIPATILISQALLSD